MTRPPIPGLLGVFKRVNVDKMFVNELHGSGLV